MKRWKRLLCFLCAGLLIFASMTAGAEEETEEGFELAPYHDVLVGVREVREDTKESTKLDTKDFEVLRQFIENKKEQLLSGSPEGWAEAGIPGGMVCVAEGPDFPDIEKQILAMTAVYRGYTFYNRVVCEWYAENLWEETWTYRMAGTENQEKAAEAALSMAGKALSLLSGEGAFGAGTEALKAALKGRYRPTAILGKRSAKELYPTDSCEFPIEVVWEGWTEEKQAECEELLSMEDEAFLEELVKRQNERLLDSPVPFYKQGAAEWGAEPFGNGTLASDACCPAAISMVLSYFKGERITPSEVAARYDQDAYRSREHGSYGGKMCQAAGNDYGLMVEAGSGSLSGEQIREALAAGKKIVMSMGQSGGGGRYAVVYHYVVLAGLTEDGKVIVNNPGINTDITYDDMEIVLENQSGRGYGIFWKS